MHTYWVLTGGAYPENWLKKHPNRFRLCHIKNRAKNAKPDDKNTSFDLGTGNINFSKILKTAADNGLKYYVFEQERYDNSTPLKSVKKYAAYLKTVNI